MRNNCDVSGEQPICFNMTADCEYKISTDDHWCKWRLGMACSCLAAIRAAIEAESKKGGRMNLPEFAMCFTKIVGAANHTLTLTEPKPGDSVLKIGFKSIEGDESCLEINVEKYLKKCSDLEAEISKLRRCGTCRHWLCSDEDDCGDCDITHRRATRRDTCDKWEMDDQ